MIEIVSEFCTKKLKAFASYQDKIYWGDDCIGKLCADLRFETPITVKNSSGMKTGNIKSSTKRAMRSISENNSGIIEGFWKPSPFNNSFDTIQKRSEVLI